LARPERFELPTTWFEAGSPAKVGVEAIVCSWFSTT